MTTSNLPPKAGHVERYGPLTAILVAIAILAVLVTAAGRDGADQVGTGARGAAGSSGGAPVETPITYAQAEVEGREQAVTWVDNCDEATGRIEMPTVYALPCVPAPAAGAAGASAPGVTAETITVVWYLAPQTSDVLASLAGNLDPPEVTRETASRYVEMLNDLATTYGRRVELEFFEGKAAAGDPVAARAEAQQVIDTFQPFASINGPGLTPAYAEEMAAQGVLCINCGIGLSDQAFQDHAPHLWGSAASPEQWITILSDYIGKRLAGRPARWAGDGQLRSATRTFAVVNFEQDPPQFASIAKLGEACVEETGWEVTEQQTYLATNMAERAPTIIASLKAQRISTVLFMGDPVMPMILTAEATRQGYFPEWVVTGTALTDLATFGRKYDPRQWEHAFGLSQLAVNIPREQRDDWRLHEWYFGAPPKAEKTSGVIWPGILLLFNGIHLAGPSLSAETFEQGMFNLPPAETGPTTPRVSYGDRGTFPVLDPQTCTSETSLVDYLGTDDMVEVWWDPAITGADEQGATNGTGKYRYANGGRRYLPGEMPETDADAFETDGAVVEFKTRPERIPDYPPPRR